MYIVKTKETVALAEVLAKYHKTEEDIIKIYHSLDHNCRCGCGGSYFRPGERGFTRALNQLKKLYFFVEDLRCPSESIDYGGNYLNIPDGIQYNKCYCLYFKEKEKFVK